MRSPAGVLVRNDVHGLGHFGAPRGSRTHIGVDLAIFPRSPVIAPLGGRVSRIGICYNDDPTFRLVEIKSRGMTHRLLYVSPTVAEDDLLQEGEQVGLSQDLRTRYNGIVPHVHWDIMIEGIENKNIPAQDNYKVYFYTNPMALIGLG